MFTQLDFLSLQGKKWVHDKRPWQDIGNREQEKKRKSRWRAKRENINSCWVTERWKEGCRSSSTQWGKRGQVVRSAMFPDDFKKKRGVLSTTPGLWSTQARPFNSAEHSQKDTDMTMKLYTKHLKHHHQINVTTSHLLVHEGHQISKYLVKDPLLLTTTVVKRDWTNSRSRQHFHRLGQICKDLSSWSK